jgi:hypothetical protein
MGATVVRAADGAGMIFRHAGNRINGRGPDLRIVHRFILPKARTSK